MAGKPHNGWSSFTAWNVSLWLDNYCPNMSAACCATIREYSKGNISIDVAIINLEITVLNYFHKMKTPDGHNISRRSLKEYLLTYAQ